MRTSARFVQQCGDVMTAGCVFRAIGWYHAQMAQKSYPDIEASIGSIHWARAAQSYLAAASVFPEDDEHHVGK
jgi:hypothetical protein